jgi:hypothetical protein
MHGRLAYAADPGNLTLPKAKVISKTKYLFIFRMDTCC